MQRPSSRRVFLRSLSLAPAALVLAGLGQRARAQDAPAEPSACPVDTSDGLPGALEFVEVSQTENQWCRTCTFWAADETGACGACQMLHRPTPAGAHCVSWAARG